MEQLTKKRFTIEDDLFIREKTTQIVMEIPFKEDCKNMCELLNALHEEKEWLEINNKELVNFIKSKGYTLKDFLDYLGQFASVGVNKEDWND